MHISRERVIQEASERLNNFKMSAVLRARPLSGGFKHQLFLILLVASGHTTQGRRQLPCLHSKQLSESLHSQVYPRLWPAVHNTREANREASPVYKRTKQQPILDWANLAAILAPACYTTLARSIGWESLRATLSQHELSQTSAHATNAIDTGPTHSWRGTAICS